MSETTFGYPDDGEDDDERDRERERRNYEKNRGKKEDDDEEERVEEYEEFDEGTEKRTATTELASVVRRFASEDPSAFLGIPREGLATAVTRGRGLKVASKGRFAAKKHKKSTTRTKARRGGWDDPPSVDKHSADDYESMIGTSEYEGLDEHGARDLFRLYDLDWDHMDSETFREWIARMKVSDSLCTALSPAFFVYCYRCIDKLYQHSWVLAVKDAQDTHEGTD